MTETVCRRCGSDLDVISVCKFCSQPLKFGCQSCRNIADEKVHVDCRNAEFLVTNRANPRILGFIYKPFLIIKERKSE